jgi:hypothetical protein
MDLQTATRIAEEYVARLGGDVLQLVLFPHETIERAISVGYSFTARVIHRSPLLAMRLSSWIGKMGLYI